MRVHEYQARALLEAAGIPVPPSEVLESAEHARGAFRRLAVETAVIKAQVHAGGRGKAGYVKLIKSANEAFREATRMFAEPMVSRQTGPEGVRVHKLLMAPAVDIAREFYVGIVVDRARRTPVRMVSAQGGGEIAATNRYIEAGKEGLRAACRKYRPELDGKFQIFALAYIEAQMDRVGTRRGFFARLFGGA